MSGWTRSPILPCSQGQLYSEGQGSVPCSAAATEGRASSAALFSQPAVVTGVMDFNTDSSGSRVTGPDLARGSSSGLDITMSPGGERAPPTSARSLLPWLLQICLSPQDTNHSVSLSSEPHHIFLHHTGL